MSNNEQSIIKRRLSARIFYSVSRLKSKIMKLTREKNKTVFEKNDCGFAMMDGWGVIVGHPTGKSTSAICVKE